MRTRTEGSGGALGRALAVGQGLYYAGTGVWPLLHMRSFEAVTGPKVERWLVRTVAVLVAAVGGTLALAGARRRVTPEVALLGAASAAGLGAVYASRGRIAPVYLADAAVEAGLVLTWAVAAIAAARPGREGAER